jgi:hypothetical protein
MCRDLERKEIGIDVYARSGQKGRFVFHSRRERNMPMVRIRLWFLGRGATYSHGEECEQKEHQSGGIVNGHENIMR